MALDTKIEMIISAQERDLGGFSVRRILPYAAHRMVGPFVFFDHMGPADFPPGHGIDVRPHPHINLATVTYLFEGKIHHRDSLGSDQVIEPGAINWMTAGRGIVHSERATEEERQRPSRLNGIQLWVALPEEHEETLPTFTHHAKETLPDFKLGKTNVRLLLGQAFGKKSPVPVHSDLFYAEIKMPKGAEFTLPSQGRETALYVVGGQARCEGQAVGTCEMVIAVKGAELSLVAEQDTHLMVLGGSSVGERYLYWNFVSSSRERLEEAKRLWATGPGAANSRFAHIPGDDRDFIPLPVDAGLPKGTIF